MTWRNWIDPIVLRPLATIEQM